MDFSEDKDDKVVYANSGGQGLLPERCRMRRTVKILFFKEGKIDRSDGQRHRIDK